MNNEEQAVLNAVMNFLDNYSKRNVEGCISSLSDSKPLLVLGTNDNEVFKTREDVRQALKKDFSSMVNIRWGELRNVHVEAAPTLANVIVELPICYQTQGKDVETLFRYALTLANEGGSWKICCGMASVPFMAETYSFSQ
jgi:hypothetical protein